jgi:GNAT superfamily N-acetyltransferase
MTIRQALDTEIDTLTKLYAEFFLEDGISTPLDKIRANLEMMMSDHRARIFVAVEDGKIIGLSSGSLTYGVEFGCAAELEDLFVVSEKRGQGWARGLTKAVLDWAENEGAGEIVLVITPEAEQQQSLTRFYEKLGFANSSRITMYRAR